MVAVLLPRVPLAASSRGKSERTSLLKRDWCVCVCVYGVRGCMRVFLLAEIKEEEGTKKVALFV